MKLSWKTSYKSIIQLNDRLTVQMFNVQSKKNSLVYSNSTQLNWPRDLDGKT